MDKVERTEDRYFPLWPKFLQCFQVSIEKESEEGSASHRYFGWKVDECVKDGRCERAYFECTLVGQRRLKRCLPKVPLVIGVTKMSRCSLVGSGRNSGFRKF